VFNGRRPLDEELLKGGLTPLLLSLTSLLHESFPHPLTYTQTAEERFFSGCAADNEKEPTRQVQHRSSRRWRFGGRGTRWIVEVVSAKSSTIKS